MQRRERGVDATFVHRREREVDPGSEEDGNETEEEDRGGGPRPPRGDEGRRPGAADPGEGGCAMVESILAEDDLFQGLRLPPLRRRRRRTRPGAVRGKPGKEVQRHEVGRFELR